VEVSVRLQSGRQTKIHFPSPLMWPVKDKGFVGRVRCSFLEDNRQNLHFDSQVNLDADALWTITNRSFPACRGATPADSPKMRLAFMCLISSILSVSFNKEKGAFLDEGDTSNRKA